jgi:hypothetical protein
MILNLIFFLMQDRACTNLGDVRPDRLHVCLQESHGNPPRSGNISILIFNVIVLFQKEKSYLTVDGQISHFWS